MYKINGTTNMNAIRAAAEKGMHKVITRYNALISLKISRLHLLMWLFVSNIFPLLGILDPVQDNIFHIFSWSSVNVIGLKNLSCLYRKLSFGLFFLNVVSF